MKPLKLRHNEWKRDYNPLLRNMKYGRTYIIAFAGVTESIKFTLKKKKIIACTWIDGTVTYESFSFIRRLANDPMSIHFMGEAAEDSE